jgi:hypothetical protein
VLLNGLQQELERKFQDEIKWYKKQVGAHSGLLITIRALHHVTACSASVYQAIDGRTVLEGASQHS